MTILISHRGNTRGPTSPYTPRENTIEAFKTAISTGIKMIEFDVRVSSDGYAIIHHDPNIQQDWLNQLPLKQLQAKYPYIPTLEAAIDCCQGKVQLDIEIKENGYEQNVIDSILESFSIQDFVITSFQPEVLENIQQLNSKIQTGLLLSPSGHELIWPYRIKKMIEELDPDFLAPHYSLIDSSWLQEVNSAQKNYWTWTVNTTQEVRRLLAIPNVAGIISDDIHLSNWL